MGFLTDNILRQKEAVRALGKTPVALLIDIDSCVVLMDEIAPLIPWTLDFEKPLTIYGLPIRISTTPNFEVISEHEGVEQ